MCWLDPGQLRKPVGCIAAQATVQIELHITLGVNKLDAVVRIQVGGETLEATAVGSPVFAHRATFQADSSLGSASISIEVDDVSISRTIHF